MNYTRLAIGLVAAVALACSEDPAGTCDPCFTSAIAFGTVVDTHGEPLPRSRMIAIWAYEHTCGGRLIGGESGYIHEAGSFRFRVSSLLSPHAARCFRVMLHADSRSEHPVDTTDITGYVEFRAETPGIERDSVRLDAVLTPPE